MSRFCPDWDKKNSDLCLQIAVFQYFGRQVGFEPTTHGTTIRYSNQLSYNRRVLRVQKYNFFRSIRQTGRNFYYFAILLYLKLLLFYFLLSLMTSLPLPVLWALNSGAYMHWMLAYPLLYVPLCVTNSVYSKT